MITAKMVCKIMAVFPSQLPVMEKWQWMADQLNDAILRERESGKAAVNDEMVERACEAFEGSHHWEFQTTAVIANTRVAMRRSIEAVAPMLASAQVPNNPTEEMLVAARDWSHRKYGKPIGNDAATGCWQAMLAAAPKPEINK